ncbi:NRDE family protein [Novosphingobium album (ex Liu et al. 2023)]|uniref:NRDE family protein n=1 Tax=Novosphingobium album (ex Liu et al. 2023) TaxID=3031130 RepID=A0ABT5WNF1_9SPHN|nr:NRDE family protein [Novosphingobium album (ex Liu et al. 2023)]MDE8651560.1 NRDE family protein [Novosphingobium album (ex Liu et al. 2023)]
MCVAAIAWAAHPRWRLVAIGNRDEYHQRPAAALARWDDASGIIAGRDLKSGGTWLGVSARGRFALVTNRRGFGDPDPSRASRGALVTDALSGSGAYADPGAVDLMAFNPFNLILADKGGARFFSNRPEALRTALARGIYGLSNGALDEPWPKTLQLKAAVLDWLAREDSAFDPLFAALADETLPGIGLHSTQPSEIRREAPDTAPFIRDPVYGTRCSTVVAIDAQGRGSIVERRFDAHGEANGETRIAFAWPE